MGGFETFENRQAAWIRFDEALNSSGFPAKYDPAHGYHTWDALMRGDVEEAAKHVLEHELNRPLAGNLHRVGKPFAAVFGPVYEDPRVAAKLAEDAERYAQLRVEVRSMLQNPEWRL